MPNGGIRRIFLINAVYIIGLGLLWGNLAGFVLCYIQQRYGILTLPQESYYVSVVPVNLDLWNILLLNAGTMVVCFAMLFIPSYITTRITPVRAIRFS
jgi:lipoprotein-releasing system permease protein